MAVNVDGDALTPEQKEVLRGFTRKGGTLLTGPPGWKDQGGGESITLDKAELERLNDIWRDVNSHGGAPQPGCAPVQRLGDALEPDRAAGPKIGGAAPGELFGLSGGERGRAFPGQIRACGADDAGGRAKSRLRFTKWKGAAAWTWTKSAVCATVRLEK